jgi:hypothetical protein
MKFACSTEINSPINNVVELFGNTDNLKKWQEGFVSFEHISGTPGEKGAKSKIVYNTGKHIIELTETITTNNLPAEITSLYEHKHMTNTMRNCFTPINADQTKMDIYIEYTKFNGVIPKLMAFFMPGVFKKQTQKWLDNFKRFAENEQYKQ